MNRMNRRKKPSRQIPVGEAKTTKSSIHIAKVTRPLLSGAVPRTRLYSQLDKGRGGVIFWVDGPPGCGKTTLVSGYLEASKLPCLWYDVDGRDADPATFFHYLGAAIRKAAPRIRRAMPPLSPENLKDIPSFSRRYFDELFARLPRKAILVLDNFHGIPDGSPFHDVIREGLSRLPPGVTAIVISRSKPPPALAGLRAARPLQTLHWGDLRLTLEETRAIVRKRSGKSPAPVVVQQLQKRADGWATGLILLLERTPAEETGSHSLRREAPHEIFEYFGEEIFKRQSPENRNFLMRSALLPTMTGYTTHRLTGREGAAKVLSFLHRNNYFTEMYPAAEPVYRYHALFREFLLERARQTYSPEEMFRLHREAAGILSESGQVEDAAELLQASGDREELRRLILAEAGDLLRQGRAQTLLGWLQSIPAGERDADPWLLYWKGSSLFPQDLAGSLACFGKAFDGFREPDGASGKFLSWAGVVDAILAERNDLFLLDRWIDWLDSRPAEGNPFPSVEIEARVSGSMLGALLYRRPQHPGIRAWMDRALSSSRAAGDGYLVLRTLIRAANFYQWTGEKAAASLAMEEIHLLSRSPTASPVHVIFGKWLEASILLCAEADTRAALRIVSEGLDASLRLGVHLWDYLLFAAGVLAALLSGDGKAAGERLEKMKAAIPPGRLLAESQYDYYSAWLHLLRSDLKGADAHIRRAVAHAEATGAVFPEILCRLAAANIAEGLGECEEARAHLLGIGDRIRSSGNRILEFMERLTEARIAFGSGDEPGGFSALRKGFELGRKQGYVNMFHWWEPEVMTRLCIKALDEGIEPAYVLDLIRKRDLSPEVPPMEIEAWPWKVRIHTMGRFSIVCDGKRVGFQGKAQQKPIHLLKALIALGGRDVPREKLADALWPEVDGDRALQSLAVTVRRLRHLLGNEGAVLVSEGRVTLSNQVCWVDCWAFKRIFARAERARQGIPEAGAARSSTSLFEKALGLYRGEFLEEEKDCPWAVALRERLRGKFLRCVREAGHSREAAGEWDAALSCYRKGMEADDLHEEFHRRIMLCLHRLGRRNEAEAAYQRCRRTLRASLNVPPSPETEAVLKSIREAGGKTPEPVS